MEPSTPLSAVYGTLPLQSSGSSTTVRLVELLPRTSCDTEALISCKLHVVCLDDTPIYTALSYVWGGSTFTKNILLDGQQFAVRQNLWNFLVRAQEDGNMGLFWIDAISINQSLVPERNHQVAMMGKIYSEATKVIAWLGTGPNSVADGLYGLGEWSAKQNGKEQDRAGPLNRSVHFTEHLDQIMSSNYWTRAWIIQEYILARNIELWCSTRTINSAIIDEAVSVFFRGLKMASILGENSVEDLKSLMNFADNFLPPYPPAVAVIMHRSAQFSTTMRAVFGIRPDEKGEFFLNVSMRFGTACCSDVRDRVYALLSLVPSQELEAFPITVDYSKSASKLFAELFLRRCNRGTTPMEVVFWGDLQRYATKLQKILKLDDGDESVMLCQTMANRNLEQARVQLKLKHRMSQIKEHRGTRVSMKQHSDPALRSIDRSLTYLADGDRA